MLSADPTAADGYRQLRQSLAAAPRHDVVPELQTLSVGIRLRVLEMIEQAGLGHIGGDFSVTDILVTLFGAVLHVDPERPDALGRDRFILSKGHSAAALYATLAHCGYFSTEELATFTAPYSPLNGHPNRRKVPGVETNTGPLGHGLPVAVGCAIGARLRDDDSRTVVVLGDGELQEGSNWEAAMTAGHQRLERLYAVVDRNRLQQGDRTEETVGLDPLTEKWASFGWEVREVDGHDHGALLDVFAPSTTGKPVAIVAHTVKGKGVSFIEDRAEWHHKVPDPQQARAAREELTR
ncbi:transketolase [Streptomyces sp. NPDC048385]|uniref:transketolase n=1 Tax=Streptomyces sp. NPDC048385 TaxID=3155145 RepID=UPI003447263E